ncbi:MAG: hypothetical protein ACTSPV_13150 [Candidatus Hodarchaeales archaeon]
MYSNKLESRFHDFFRYAREIKQDVSSEDLSEFLVVLYSINIVLMLETSAPLP